MAVIRQEDGTYAIKVLVESKNQICLNAIDSLANWLKENGTITSCSRVNSNGGFLMHFLNKPGLLKSFVSIKEVVDRHDDKAKIIVNHCPE